MGEYFPGEISIGGKASMTTLHALYIHVQEAGADFDWGQDNAGIGTFKEFVDHLRTNEYLKLSDAEASFGSFYELEEFCRENNLPYLRKSDAHHEFDAEYSWWTPGMKKAKTCPTGNSNDSPLLSAPVILAILKNEALTDAGRVSEIFEYLDTNTPDDLPEFEIDEHTGDYCDECEKERPKKAKKFCGHWHATDCTFYWKYPHKT